MVLHFLLDLQKDSCLIFNPSVTYATCSHLFAICFCLFNHYVIQIRKKIGAIYSGFNYNEIPGLSSFQVKHP